MEIEHVNYSFIIIIALSIITQLGNVNEIFPLGRPPPPYFSQVGVPVRSLLLVAFDRKFPT